MKRRPGNLRRPIAKGVPLPSGERQIVCAFDEDSFNEIRKLAAKSGVSFRAQVRLLVEFGIEDVKSEHLR